LEVFVPLSILKDFLDKQHIRYECLGHSRAYTAQEVAAAAHVSGKSFAKIVIVKAGGQFAMVVLPAHDHINFAALQALTGFAEVNLAAESEFKSQFPDCEVGAMPPFGNLFGLPVYASNQLSQHAQMTFSAGTHIELMRMAYADFERLVKPSVIETNDW
jgi:Ala-tRNA(Pro) deacylase